MKLYVGNFAHTMTELELEKLFSSHGQVHSVRIITDHFTRQSKCFGYIEMGSEHDASKAIEMLHGTIINEKFLVVKKARSRDERRGRPW